MRLNVIVSICAYLFSLSLGTYSLYVGMRKSRHKSRFREGVPYTLYFTFLLFLHFLLLFSRLRLHAPPIPSHLLLSHSISSATFFQFALILATVRIAPLNKLKLLYRLHLGVLFAFSLFCPIVVVIVLGIVSRSFQLQIIPFPSYSRATIFRG